MTTRTRKPKFADLKVGDAVLAGYEPSGSQFAAVVTGIDAEQGIFFTEGMSGGHVTKDAFTLATGTGVKTGGHSSLAKIVSRDPVLIEAVSLRNEHSTLSWQLKDTNWYAIPLDQLRRIKAILDTPTP